MRDKKNIPTYKDLRIILFMIQVLIMIILVAIWSIKYGYHKTGSITQSTIQIEKKWPFSFFEAINFINKKNNNSLDINDNFKDKFYDSIPKGFNTLEDIKESLIKGLIRNGFNQTVESKVNKFFFDLLKDNGFNKGYYQKGNIIVSYYKYKEETLSIEIKSKKNSIVLKLKTIELCQKK